MKRFSILILVFIFSTNIAYSLTIKGIVKDAQTKEELIGAVVWIRELNIGTTTGLDGSFQLQFNQFPATLVCSYFGYVAQEITIENSEQTTFNFFLTPNTKQLAGVVIQAESTGNTDIGARAIERNALNVMNVVSARSIETSPDMTVANVIQRMSGVVMERDNSGDGQYALLRGMDKRFNYTLVNGVKIPSPDNKNRFVPLDIFPSELLDRLEVTKALTADMEGDGIGGAVNMVMKEAPSKLQVTANLSTGFITQFFSRNFQTFKYSAINRESLFTKYGSRYEPQLSDFTTKNLNVTERNFPMNLAGGFSVGGRVFKDRLGMLVAASYSNAFRGSTSDRYFNSFDAEGAQNITHRYYSTIQKRAGAHAIFDVRLHKNHKLMWYNAYMDFQNIQVRDAASTDKHDYRLRWNHQSILTSTLKGYHDFLDTQLKMDWSFVYGYAANKTPDNTTVNLRIGRDGRTYAEPTGSVFDRRWEKNSDNDIAAYVNLTYQTVVGAARLDYSVGGLYRNKQRTSIFHEYFFRVSDPVQRQYWGEDWNNFDEISVVFDRGRFSDPLNYDASEQITAGYAQAKMTYKKLHLIAGIRMEHTIQGYDLKFPQNGRENTGEQKYYSWLPNFHARYNLPRNQNLRFSYVKAINRPSFFEIVPYSKQFEDYYERGNPDIRHTVAHNLDLRYEYFPRSSEQIMAGVFYKYIIDPIEYTMVDIGQQAYYMPFNYGNAYNLGFEVDVTKYLKQFGVRANYTFTHSQITTNKWLLKENPDPDAETNTIIEDVKQTRQLFGQAAHVVNFALLYKNTKRGWDAQLALSYTSKRLVYIDKYIDEDLWQDGYLRLDASVEKTFKKIKLTIFAKATNLLNTPMYQFINPNERQANLEALERRKGGILDRKDLYGQTILLGLKYKL